MTPNDIEVLLHYHTCGDPHPRLEATAVKEAKVGLVRDELLVRNAVGNYDTTEKGEAHIRQLCRIPLPTQAWLDGNDDVIPK